MRLIQFTAADGWRGHEQKIIYLHEAFRDCGSVESQWIVCRNDSKVFGVARDKGLEVLGYDFRSEYDLKFARTLAKLCRELRADVLFIHSSKAHTLAILSRLFFGLGIPLVLCRTMIGRVDTNFFRKWKYNYGGIAKIICVSQPVVDSLKFAVKDHSKLRIVGSMTDLAKFPKTKKDGLLHREFGIPEDYKIVGNVAALEVMKDIPTWILTVAELVKRGLRARYVLVGKGSLEQQMRSLAAAHGLEEHIIFAGFRNDVPLLLPEFDVLLFTSNNEPTGGVILESYACHVPVVATRAGGVPTIVSDGETGLLAEVGNPSDFADKVEQMLGDAALREHCVAQGYQFLLANSTKEVVSKQMFDELDSVVRAYKR